MKFYKLIAIVGDGCDRAEHSFCNGGAVNCVGHGQDLFLDLRAKPQHAHDLGHTCPSDAFSFGDAGLVGDLAGLEERLPLDGFCVEARPPVVSWTLWVVWDCPDLTGRHSPPCLQTSGGSGPRCCLFQTPPWARGRSRPFVRGRRSRGRRFGHSGRGGRS